MEILEAYTEVRLKLHSHEKASFGKPQVLTFLEDMRGQLNKLVPKNFIQLYTDDRLLRLVRYIQAIALRAERGRASPEKDKIKAGRIEPFERRLNPNVAKA